MVNRRRRTCLLAVVATLASTPGILEPQARPLVITRVSVVDVVGGRLLPDRTVTIGGDTIRSVVHDGVPPTHAHIVDGQGKFLIPGLWDMHAHNQASGTESLELYLANGVMGARDMGSDLEFILPLRDRIRRGELNGPEIVAAGPILDDAPAEWPFRRRVRNAGDARDAVRDLKHSGVDLIKVHNNTPRDAFFAIAKEARTAGLSFAGHIPLGVTMDEGAASGINSIEHLSEFRLFRECAGTAMPYDASRCRLLFEKIVARKIWQTPTITMYRVLPDLFEGKPLPHVEYASDSTLQVLRQNMEASKVSEQMVAFLRGMAVQSLAAIRDLVALGNVFLAGCDGGVPGFCLHDELEALTEAGLSPLQAIQTATVNAAACLGRQAGVGTIEAGKRADLVLLDANPLTDIRSTRRIAAVVARGRLLTRADIDRILADHRRPQSVPSPRRQ